MNIKRLYRSVFSAAQSLTVPLMLISVALIPAWAASPWERAVEQLQVAFTGPIARGLSLVAIVIGGLGFAYGEGDAKKTVAGIVFGTGMALAATQFMSWLFG